MTGLTSLANSKTFVDPATAESIFGSPHYFSNILVDNSSATVTLYLTTDGSNPNTGAGAGSLIVPPNSQMNFSNMMALPNENVAGFNSYKDVACDQSDSWGWTTQNGLGFNGTAYATYTSTLASPAVFTSAAIAALGNNTLVQLESTGIPTGFTAGTVYYVVGVSGSTFNLAATSGGSGVNGSGTGTGLIDVVRTCCAVTPGATDAANITVTFQ